MPPLPLIWRRNLFVSLKTERDFPGGASGFCLPMQKTEELQVRSPGQEDPLEEGMATYSSILDWRIQGAWWPTVHRVPRVGHASYAKTEKGRSR